MAVDAMKGLLFSNISSDSTDVRLQLNQGLEAWQEVF